MTKRSGIYQWVNEINGKSYVGSSKDVMYRKRIWLGHFKLDKMRYKCYIHDAVRKYGIENFTFIVLEECEPTKATLEERENYYFDLIRPEYNVLRRAYTCLGRKQSPAEIAKRVASNRGFVMSEEQRAVCSKTFFAKGQTPWNYGKAGTYTSKPLSEETKAKIGAANKGRGPSAEARAKASAARIGVPAWNRGIELTPEHRAKLSLVRKGRVPWNKGIPQTEEVKAKLSAAKTGRTPWNKGTPMSDEQRVKLSQAHKGQPAHNKGKPANPASIAKRQATRAANRLAKLALAA